MAALSPVLRSVDWNGKHAIAFWCPGCEGSHVVTVRTSEDGPHPSWKWNGNVDKPTLSPSILVTYNGPDAGELDDGIRVPYAVCHSFVNDGMIQFLGDCTHALAGQTVPLPEFKA